MSSTPHAAGIKALGPDELERLVSAHGQPRFRADQIAHWLYGRGATDWSEMTDLPRGLRDELARSHPLTTLEQVDRRVSDLDGTRKYLWRLADGTSVESVGIPTADRLTVCFSTQAGCAMGCAFCATGREGLSRSLAPGEMVDQVRLVGADFGRRVTNAVAMGQGEPFANYDATLGALRFMNSPRGLGIGARHLTVSTCGLLPSIRRFSHEPEQFTLAVSLHSAVQSTRDALMPGVRNAPLEALRTTVREYTDATGRRVTFEYALIAGVNDTAEEIRALTAFCRGLLCHVNLIPMNPVTDSGLGASAPDIAAAVAHTLAHEGVEVSVRAERGADIEAACGQLKQLHAEDPP